MDRNQRAAAVVKVGLNHRSRRSNTEFSKVIDAGQCRPEFQFHILKTAAMDVYVSTPSGRNMTIGTPSDEKRWRTAALTYSIPFPALGIMVSVLLGIVVLILAATIAIDYPMATDYRRSNNSPRNRVIGRLWRSRIVEMLKLRGIDWETYLRATPTPSLTLHLSLCSSCTESKKCIAALNAGGANSFEFCTLGSMIERLIRAPATTEAGPLGL